LFVGAEIESVIKHTAKLQMVKYKEAMVRANKNQLSSVNQCLYYQNTANEIVIWISCGDNCLLVGNKEEVSKYKIVIHQFCKCEDIGELNK
jgi:hypothetical protein